MEKVYCFNSDEFSEAIEKIYSVVGMYSHLEYSNLSMENFLKLKQILDDTINNPQLKEKVVRIKNEEEITCLPEQAKKVFDQLFDNENLCLYGHGGEAKDIIESEGFRCRYADLSSHFLPLEKTNNSLNLLNNWPHKNASKIAILALNITEYNPIYKQREARNTDDTDIYTIPNEYFVGYYDSKEKSFVLNPNFRVNHDYNPENTIYQNEKYFGRILPKTQDETILEFFRILNKISNVLFFSSLMNLSKESYINVKKQVLNYMGKAEKLQNKFTPEYLENLKKVEELQVNESKQDDAKIYNNDDWNFDDWDPDDFEVEKETSKKR